ncbi:hypothetical protein HAHE_32470 [Haloferula helveola]|uniref:PpiC domain-containing protein n=1 Tax=Haloferula helveola TaxID=490095 RepID=A0ABN6H713_9BACT|nr:hypothetical protein HAHE_32470 [Haloferula helveola]
MIENIRRYTGLIIVVIVLLLLGFIFMDTSGIFTRSAGSGTYVTVNGRGYSYPEYQKLGPSSISLIQRLPDYQLYGFFNALRGDAQDENNQNLQFFAGRVVIKNASEEFGIYPSDEDVQEFVEGLRVFQTQPPAGTPPGTPGEFNQTAYNAFKESLGSYGLFEHDFLDLIRDVIATEEVRTIVGGGLPGSRHLAEAMTVVRSQQVEASVASIDTAPFVEKIQPTDEELQEYWETRKDAFKTEKRIKVSYVLASPQYPDDIVEKPEAPDAPEKTPEEQEKADAEKQAREEARAKVDKELAIAVDDFINKVHDSEGEDYVKLVGEKGWTLVQTDWVTETTLPADLKLRPRATAGGKSVANHLFGLTLGPDPLAPFTDAIGVGDNQWLVARLDEVEEVREKSFDEAKEEVKEQYVDEKADEAIKAEVEAKTEALKKSIEGGKSFEDAAKELELEPKKLGPWAMSDTLDDESASREIFQLASTVNPGEFAEPLYQDDRAVIIHVDNRQIIKDDNRGQQIDSLGSNLEIRNENAAFAAWLNEEIRQANLQTATP